MTEAHRRLAAIATGQLGVFTRAQANGAGLSDDQLRRRVRSGILEPVGPHSFRSPLAPRSALGNLAALVVDIGPPCWVSGPTAAALHSFDGFRLRPPFHLMLLRDRNVRRLGAIIHTTGELPLIDRGHAEGLDVLSGARTVIDLARHADGPTMSRAIDSGLRDGLFNEDLLHRRVVALRSSGRCGLPRLLDVLAGDEATRGGHSWLERRFLQMLADAGLPRPQTQQVVTTAQDRMVRVDCWFPGTNVVVELLGYSFHRSPQHLARDAARLNALLLAGHAPYQFTYEQVVADPAFVLESVDKALAASGRGRSA